MSNKNAKGRQFVDLDLFKRIYDCTCSRRSALSAYACVRFVPGICAVPKQKKSFEHSSFILGSSTDSTKPSGMMMSERWKPVLGFQ